MTTADNFVWVGNDAAHGGATLSVDGATAGGVTGGSTGNNWLTTNSYWGLTANWRMKVEGGYSGDGENGYKEAQRVPSGGDNVILQAIPEIEGERNPGDTGDWPFSELLYGGVSGATWANLTGGGTNGQNGGQTGTCNMEVQNSYYNNPAWGNTPYSKMRLGISRVYDPVGSFKGLNLFIDTFSSNSEPVDDVYNQGYFVRFMGSGTKINTVIVNGVGKYHMKTAYCQTVLLDGEAWDPDNFENHSLNYYHTGDIGDHTVAGLIKISCKTLDQFNWVANPGSTMSSENTAIICAAKRMQNGKGQVRINGPFHVLSAYPWEDFPEGYTGGAKIQINSNVRSQTLDRVILREYNPFQGTVYKSEQNNLAVSFNNRNGTDTLSLLEVEAGRFETDDLNSKLIITEGTMNEEGILDLRSRKPGGSIEVAGMSGGEAGAGIFNASGNSTLLLPDSVNFALKVESGGETAAAVGGFGINQQGGKR